MKARNIKTWLVALATLTISSQAVAAGLSYGVSASMYNTYAWRGFVLADTMVMQPNADLGFGDFGLNIWGSYAIADRDKYEGADELDFTLSYSPTLQVGGMDMGVSVGFIEYTFMNGGDGAKHSEEAFLGVSLDSLPLAPSITAYYDFNLGDGAYISLGVGHSIEIMNGLAASIAASVGVGNQSGLDMGYNDAGFSLALDYSLAGLTVSPAVGYSMAREEANADGGALWFGGTLAYSGS